MFVLLSLDCGLCRVLFVLLILLFVFVDYLIMLFVGVWFGICGIMITLIRCLVVLLRLWNVC